MIKKLSILGFLAVLSAGCQTQSKIPANQRSSEKSSGELKSYAEVIPEKAETDEGLFTTHFANEKLYYEIPLDLLGKDMLLVSRIDKVPSGFGGGYVNAGSKVNEQVVRWEKRGNNIDLRVISFENVSDEDDPITQSVIDNNFSPILYSAEIKAYNPDSTAVVVEVSSLYENDIKAINAVSPRMEDRYKVKGLDKDRSFIASVQSFPKNIEVEHVMTYEAEEPPEDEQAGTLSILMNQSMVLLPEDKMQPRYADPRVGWFTIDKIDYSSDALKSDEFEIIRRWRLVPKDIEAYMRGELVEPVKPIVFYLDPATPEKWRPYFKQGIEDWNAAFETAGFKNAVIAKDAPTEEENPEFSAEDARYSVVRYVASTTRNAMGPSVVDPRTGEILESDITWYHNHLRSYRNRYMIEAGAQRSSARTLETPEKEIGEMMRMVIAHEVGHALGLPHNMKSSSAYPTDSLRSAEFTQKYGLTPSIMDYARINYVAQPGDEGIRYIRKLGPYDHYAINWGYRYLPQGPKEEEEILDQWILEKAGNPVYEFGGGYDGVDPQSQRESLGADQVKASKYGLANLKKVVPNLVEWTTTGQEEDYEALEEVYEELTRIWRGYISHVITNIGGVNETIKTTDQEGAVYEPVPEEMQEKAMDFLLTHAFTTPEWLLNQEILSRIEATGAIERIQELQTRSLNYLLDEERLKRMISNQQVHGDEKVYTALEMLTELRRGIFSELYNGEPVDAYRRNLQRSFVDIAIDYIQNLKKEDSEEILKSDVIALMRGELENLRADISRYDARTNDQLTRYHWNDLIARINEGLEIE